MRPISSAPADSLPAPPTLRLNADALFLDLDGTLLEIAERPDHVAASADLLSLLERLSLAMKGALALITGRTIADADAILGGVIPEVAGVHGFELRGALASVVNEKADTKPLEAARPDAYALADRLNLLLEDKGASLAIHFRTAPHRASEVNTAANEIARRHGLRVLHGRMVVELVAGVRTKGDALAAFMAHPPFTGRRPVAVGDDITDEHAFARADALGGFGILVGAPRATSASYRIDGPPSVFAWLKAAMP